MRVFLYIRLQYASTLGANYVTSSTRRGVHGLLPNSLLREMTGKRAALALRALDVEPAAMPLQGVLDDGETQPRPALPAGQAGVDAIEALGQAGDVLRRDADAAVDHGKVGTVRIDPPAHPHRALRQGVFHPVHQQIGEGGFELVRGTKQPVR